MREHEFDILEFFTLCILVALTNVGLNIALVVAFAMLYKFLGKPTIQEKVRKKLCGK